MTTPVDDTPAADGAPARRKPLDPDATRRAAPDGGVPHGGAADDGVSLGHLALDLGTSSSAATFFVNIDHQGHRDRNQAAVLLAELATVLDTHADRIDDKEFLQYLPTWPGLPETKTMEALVERLRNAAEVETHAAGDPFAEDEDEGVGQRHRLLDATCVAVEMYLGEILEPDPEQDRLLMDDVLEAHRRSGRAVALARARLVIARLADQRDDIPSALVLAKGSAPRLGGQDSSDGTVLRDLKTHLAIPRDLTPDEVEKVVGLDGSWTRDSDLLLGSAYVDLVRRVHEYCGTGPSSTTADGPGVDATPRSVRRPKLDGRRAFRVVVTYPCVTPPQARTRLAQLVADATGRPERVVDVAWDEAVAAAMFFVARALGAETEIGVEALCAASRWSPDEGGLRRWRRTLLVVDIGGGTTDIALVSLDLTENVPDPDPRGPDLYRARSFDLRPRVLGTGGHDQLGGNLISLRLFYWLKALVVDALLHEQALPEQTLSSLWADTRDDEAVPESLAEACTRPEYQEPTDPAPAPRAVRRIVARILPTDAASVVTAGEHTDPHAAFLHIWEEAERIKHAWAEGEPVALAPRFLTQLGEKLGDRGAATDSVLEALQRLSLELPVERIEALVRPVYDEAMRLAGSIARERLGASEDPVLDTVALAGRSCGVDIARRSARDVIGRVLRDPARVDRSVVTWEAASVEVERQRAKQAASLGAAWVASRAAMQTHASRAGQRGRTDLRIHAGDLFLQLPCSFSAAGPEGKDVDLLTAGTPFTRARSVGEHDHALYVLSDWTPMSEVIELQRVVEPDGTREWGRFDVLERGGAEFSLSAEHRYCVRMDQQLRPSLHLRVGDVTAWEMERAGATEVRLFERWPDAAPGREVKVPRIEVENRDTGARSTLFPGGTETWDLLLPTAGAETPKSSGVVSAGYVPLTADRREDTRLRIHVEGHDRSYDVDIPGEPGLAVRWAAIDRTGTLLLMAREPLWPQAATVAQLADRRGGVFTAGFGPPRQRRSELREPFNGRH